MAIRLREDADDSDGAIAEALQRGDVAGLERLYDRYGTLAYSVAMRVLGDHGRSEDVVQECFLKLWNSSSRFDINRGSLRTWLITAVRNRSIDHLRGRAAHERREREIPFDAEAAGEGSNPWREVVQGMERELIQEALERLPQEQRQAVELAFYHGYTQKEIAESVNVPLSTIKGRMRLALEKLHSYLQGRGLIDDA
ncbi:MAG: sigma-70 family RNA polymerase sigma factor [Candidatus Dormibacteraeota bacterium]|uniref:Sigma-70 family RNA polymerase sigma factor n=1 Tax=Candidatus Dormiibacter inghamiae TaxID=3127013 RepID=A0A934KAV3_9BACT|nr:sigma-70 family RNA polymerase sigma factor [Candidatus Dormibacteraeota bacterium]MBJ7605402.1 sigma-70 family RNA polymerase sigma factor [Candidatus Dormibacteraeota bacterium]